MKLKVVNAFYLSLFSMCGMYKIFWVSINHYLLRILTFRKSCKMLWCMVKHSNHFSHLQLWMAYDFWVNDNAINNVFSMSYAKLYDPLLDTWATGKYIISIFNQVNSDKLWGVLLYYFVHWRQSRYDIGWICFFHKHTHEAPDTFCKEMPILLAICPVQSILCRFYKQV